MDIKKEDLKNIEENNVLNEKLNNIFEDSKIESKYEKCKIMLEYININFILNKLKTKLEDYNILKIIETYRKFDDNLFNQMKSINSLYNIVDERALEEEDIEYLLIKTNSIYGYMKEKYGEVIKENR